MKKISLIILLFTLFFTSNTFAQVKVEQPFKFIAFIGCQADKMGDAIVAMEELLKTMPKSESRLKYANSTLKNIQNSFNNLLLRR